VPWINGWGGAGTELAKRLATLTEDSIDIACRNDCPAPEYISQSGAFANPRGNVKFFMNICAGNPPFSDSNRRALVRFGVFRELIRLCGGNAVDMYGLHAYFVETVRSGSTTSWGSPGPYQRSLMCAEGRQLRHQNPPHTLQQLRAGTFMVWNNAAGIYSVGNKVNPDWYTGNPSDFPNMGLINWRHACP